MKLKEYLEKYSKDDRIPLDARLSIMSGLAENLIQLDSVSQYFELMFGIELDINVKPIKPRAGRNYGVDLAEKIRKKVKE